MARKQSKGGRNDSPKEDNPLLTPAELVALDGLIAELEKRPDSRAAAGLLPGIINTFAVVWVVRWMVVRALLDMILRKILGGGVAGRELSEAQMREAEDMLLKGAAPSLADLKAVRDRITKRRK